MFSFLPPARNSILDDLSGQLSSNQTWSQGIVARVFDSIFRSRHPLPPVLPEELFPVPVAHFRLPGGELDTMMLTGNTREEDGISVRRRFSDEIINTGVAARLTEKMLSEERKRNNGNLRSELPMITEWTLFVTSVLSDGNAPKAPSYIAIAAIDPQSGSTIVFSPVATFSQTIKKIRANRLDSPQKNASLLSFTDEYKDALGDEGQEIVHEFAFAGIR